jgi:hypothetical protein
MNKRYVLITVILAVCALAALVNSIAPVRVGISLAAGWLSVTIFAGRTSTDPAYVSAICLPGCVRYPVPAR